jgi:predicted nucleic acid-binding protein
MNLPNELFVDTSFLIALANNADVNHHNALALQSQLRQQKVWRITSEYVLFELGDGLSRLRFRSVAQRMLELLRRDKRVEIIPASTTLLAQSLQLFSQRPDKEWGLTDCSSFVIMQQKGLYAALTADHHFEQAGFLPLLRTNNS